MGIKIENVFYTYQKKASNSTLALNDVSFNINDNDFVAIVGETGSYTSLSRSHWLEQMAINYHDQKVYDYFKDNYPDLFE